MIQKFKKKNLFEIKILVFLKLSIKMLILFLEFIFTLMIDANQQIYSIYKNIDSNNLNGNSLLSSFESTSKTHCLSSCNLYQTCLNVIFNELTSYCLLFSNYFNLSESNTLSGLTLYSKKCKNLILNQILNIKNYIL